MDHVQVTMVKKNINWKMTASLSVLTCEVEFHCNKDKEPNYSNFIAGLSVCIQNLNFLNTKKELRTYRFHDDDGDDDFVF